MSYQTVGALRPGRTSFDLSSTKYFDCNIGVLLPVMLEDVLPGDIWQIGCSHIAKVQPMVVPVFHRMRLYVHYFFVPYRILWKDWEKYITGGANGDINLSLPRAFPPSQNMVFPEGLMPNLAVYCNRFSLWDYFGLPIQDLIEARANPSNLVLEDEMYFYDDSSGRPNILDFPWRAYWAIWRDYYRDENHQLYFPNWGTSADNRVVPGQDLYEQYDAMDMYMASGFYPFASLNLQWAPNIPAYRCFAKDYFTSALPWQQRGPSAAVPLSGIAESVSWPNAAFNTDGPPPYPATLFFHDESPDPRLGIDASEYGLENMVGFFARGQIDVNQLGIDVSEMRYAVQVQKFLERSARAGYRYTEHLGAHFGVNPRDDRLHRPEYIGGTVSPVMISEVLQTGATTDETPQGNFAGYGISAAGDRVAKYRVLEHGCIMGIMSIMPDSVYQQGVPRWLTRQTRFDWYSPEFAHLSEQEIKQSEIAWTNNPAYDELRFGFQGAWDEYRSRADIVCGNLANQLKHWTLSRIFSKPPALNEAFLTTESLSKTRRQAWAVPGVVDNQQGQFFVQWRNNCHVLRPLPFSPEPGLMDHF